MMSARRFLQALTLLGALPLSSFAAALTNYAAANLVLGQTLFTTNTAQAPATAGSLKLPSGAAVDPISGKVFVADQGNNRVLRYASKSALKSGAAAELVFGQVNFSAGSANQGNAFASQTSLSGPGAVFVDAAGNLWIADTGNNRVLMFGNAANISSMPAFADRVLGQLTFVANAAISTNTYTITAPGGLGVDSAGVLWVADPGSHRVIGFKAAATLANGANADYVIGQANFTTNTAGTTQTTVFNPTGVTPDTTGHLWVADRGNNRALMFANPPLINGPPANVVLGQKDYISNTAGVSSTALNQPTSVFASGTSLWVADDFNNRVLRFDKAATRADGTAANAVIGQANFTGKLPGLSAKQVSLLSGQVSVDAGGSLWVADRLNNRILRFTPAATVNAAPTVTVNGRQSFKVTTKSVTLFGTAADDVGILRVSYALGSGTYKQATGTTTWQTPKIKLQKGKNYITVNSVDTQQKASAPVVIIVRYKPE